jgi:glycosyltransferase involved in cell wall biosynthesis
VTATHWHLLSGEYPPKRGGVADYTRQLARALASRGETVHVWAPSAPGDSPDDPGVHVHPVPGLGPRGLRQLDRELRTLPVPRRWFVQYVPTGLGLRGMNVPLIRWLSTLRDELWVQFHEVALGWQLWRKPHNHLVHAMQLWMASAVARRADRIFISIEGWRPRLGTEGSRAVWLPVPSNLPVEVLPSEQALARRALGPGPWIGHFGTYGPGITRDLVPALHKIARENSDVRFLLLGRGADRFAHMLPAARVVATAELPADAVAARLGAADLALQPFPDGISTRRASAMAALALGVPVVTNEGHLTDQVWREGAVALAPAAQPQQLARLCLDLLADPQRRELLGKRGALLYGERFSMERTLGTLLSASGATLAASS